MVGLNSYVFGLVGVAMSYRSVGKILTIEKKLTDPRDVLERVEKELCEELGVSPTAITRSRTKLRPTLHITFPTRETAQLAEEWVDKTFEL